MGAVGLKAATSLATLLSVPIALHHLGDERYGVWVDLSGMVFIVSMLDLGLSSGLVNHVIVARAKGDTDEISRKVSNTFFTMVVTSLALMALAVFLIPLIPWTHLIRLRESVGGNEANAAINEVVPAFMILCCGTLMMLPLEVYNRVQLAYDEPMRASFWAGTYTLGSLAGVFLASRLTHGLPSFVGLSLALPLLLHFVSAGWEVGVRKPWLRPRLVLGSLRMVGSLVRRGQLFLLYQIAFAFTMWSDYPILGSILGADANTPYSVCFRLFSAGLLASYASRGLWLAFMTAIAKGEYAWARGTFRRLCILNAAFGLAASVALVLASPLLIRFWIGDDKGITFGLRVAFGVWLFVFNFVEMLVSICMGTNALRVHTYLYAAAAVGTLALRLWLTRRLGLTGIVWGAVIAYSVVYVVPAGLWLYRHLGSLRERLDAPERVVEESLTVG